jgi:uncharacterized protein (DUF39 family)
MTTRNARKFMRENENGAVQYDDEECHRLTSNFGFPAECSNPSCEECRRVTSNLMAPLVKCFNPSCDQFEKRKGKYLTCGQCRKVIYCSKDCQRAHWKAGHKQECPELKKMADENAEDLIEKMKAAQLQENLREDRTYEET